MTSAWTCSLNEAPRSWLNLSPHTPAPLSLESNEPHGTHIGEKLPRLWYIVEATAASLPYTLRVVGGARGFPRPARRRPRPAWLCVSRGKAGLCVCVCARWRGVAVGI